MSDVDPFAWSLRSREPGQSAIEKVRELRAAGAPEREVRAWELGAQGERIAGRLFERLGPEWTVLHDVPVGSMGSNIDHVLIGRAGVFTVNTKHHPRADVVVTGAGVWVRGEFWDYAEKARFEGKRASRALSDCAGGFVAVQPLLLFVGTDDVTVTQEPRGVMVAKGEEILTLLETFTPEFTPRRVGDIVMAAVQPETWVYESRVPWESIPERKPRRAVPAAVQVSRVPEYRRRRKHRDRGLAPVLLVSFAVVFVLYMLLASLVNVYGEPLGP